MKIVHPQQRKHLIAIQKKRLRRLWKRRRRCAAKRRQESHRSPPWWTDDIKAPRIFDILDPENRGDLLHFIETISNAAAKTHAKIRLDFYHTEKMVVSGTLLFRAHMTKLCQQYPATVFKCSKPKSRKISEVLTKIRLLALFSQDFHVNPHHSDVIHWNLAEGKGADGEKFESILGAYDGTLSPRLSKGLYLGITEAMTNTRHHAYPIKTQGTEWWMFSQERHGWLTVAICDLGVGIPATLPDKQPYTWAVIKRAFNGKATDAKIMETAIRLKRTRTHHGHRGKGLTQLANVVDQTQHDSSFFIYSGKGCYAKSNKKVILHDYESPISGTVITWKLPL